jgi:biopolymer transport protein ExbD
MSRRTRGPAVATVDGYLELMPLMNVLVALLPMLLLSAVFVKVTVIDLDAPPAAEAAAPAVEKPSLALAITIKDDYFVVEGQELPKRVISRKAPDAGVQLAGVLADVVVQFPENQEIMIISQPHTRYDDIIAVMDISREAGLPSVSLLGDQ